MTSHNISHNIQEPVPFTEAVTPACLPSISPRLREDKVTMIIVMMMITMHYGKVC